MPKGKPKARNPILYKNDESVQNEIRSVVPQGAAHRRGGTHCVKDSDRTNTHWDDKSYQELLIVAKDRGVWRKDMPKKQMAKALAAKDRADRVAAKKVADEANKLRKEIEEKSQKEKEEKEKRQWEKEARRRERERLAALGEDLTSSSSDEDDGPSDGNVGVGQILDDEDDESTTTITTIASSLAPISPALKLRIFEWQYGNVPDSSPPLSPILPSNHFQGTEPLPIKIPYMVMNVVTTKTRETLELPGCEMPEEVGPDFVPSLPEHTKDCARNGVLLSPLRNAVIERGSDWAARTQVQWWNGRMYFHLPPRKSKTDLASVYAKWRKKKIANSQERRKVGAGIQKLEPKAKVQQRLQDQREKMLDVYAASEYRPPICYVPSYLGYPLLDDDEEVEKSPHNLFYIRFRGVCLPHYFFWADPAEWEDPTVPNPAWFEREARASSITYQHSPHKAQALVKRIPLPHKFSALATPPKGSKYKVAIWAIERDLYHHGWANTMYVLRDKWLKEGKGGRWTRLISRIVEEFPAGRLPNSPPVCPPRPNTTSLAEKLAAVDVPSPLRFVEPIQGDEHWTRDDSAYWVTVDFAPDQKLEENIQHELLRSGTPTEPQALHRRPSEVFAWMDNIGSPHTPSTTLAQPSPLVHTSIRRMAEREAWEERFVQHVEEEAALVSTIDSMPVAELKHSLFNLVNERRQSSVSNGPGRCFVCLTTLDGLTSNEWRAHHEMHAQSASELCPFCGLPWVGLPGETKAAHIFWHDVDEGASRKDTRRFSGASSEIGGLAAVPMIKKGTITRDKEMAAQAGPSRLSKVYFSPVTATRRTAYNDHEGEGYVMDADISSASTTSPRRTSRRFQTTSIRTPRRSALRTDVSTRSNERRSRKPEADSRSPTSPSIYTSSPEFQDYPHVDWDPRRTSTTSLNSLEYYRRKKGSRRNVKNAHEIQTDALERRNSRASTKGNKRKKHIDEDEYTYADEPSSASSYELAALYTKRGRLQDPSYHDTIPSPPSSSASLALVLPKRKRAADSQARQLAKRRDIKTSKMKIALEALHDLADLDDVVKSHRDSTASNVSSASNIRRMSAVEWPELDVVEKPKGKRKTAATPRISSASSSTSQPSSVSKKRKAGALEPITAGRPATVPASKKPKTSNAFPKVLNIEGSSGSRSDYIAFVNDDANLMEDYFSDVLTGNSFAGPSKRTKAESKITGAQIKAANDPKTANLKWPYVEPLAIAPAASTPTLSGVEDVLEPPTSSTSDTDSPKDVNGRKTKAKGLHTPELKTGLADNGRGRRSSAPTPSPSLPTPSSQLPAFGPITVIREAKGKESVSPLPLDVTGTKRKASYDVSLSDVRHIVPPNTPSPRLQNNGRQSDKGESRNDTPLDAGQLNDRIGNVQTTSGGSLRESPVGLVKSVVGKAMPSGTKKPVGKPKPKRKRKTEVEKLMEELDSSEKRRVEEEGLTVKTVKQVVKRRTKAVTKKPTKPSRMLRRNLRRKGLEAL
jgi:hypothetical protein